MIGLAFAFVPEGIPFAEGAASYLAAYSVVVFVMVSTAVSVTRAAAGDDGEASDTSDDSADEGVIDAADADRHARLQRFRSRVPSALGWATNADNACVVRRFVLTTEGRPICRLRSADTALETVRNPY
jgi:hypothetical protein